MPDPTPAQVATGTMPPAGTSTTTPTGEQKPQPEPTTPASEAGPEKFDAAYVKELRNEAAENRRKLRDLEAKVKVSDDAKLTETEKTAKRLAELELRDTEHQQRRQEMVVRYEVMLAAGKMNLIDPDAAYRLLDLAALEFADDGTPKNIDAVLKALVKARPYLVKQETHPPDINAADGKGSGASPSDPKAREAELRQRFRIS